MRELRFTGALLLVAAALALGGCESAVKTASPSVAPSAAPASASPTPVPTPAPPISMKQVADVPSEQEADLTPLADGRVLVAGGYVPPKGPCAQACTGTEVATSWLFDPTTNEYRATGSMKEPRAGYAGVLLHDGRVLVIGGLGCSGVPMASAEVYDPAKGAFTSLGNLNQQVSGEWNVLTGQSAIVLLDGRVLIVGGANQLGQGFDAATIFDPTTDAFTNIPGMTTARYEPTVTLLPDGRVLIAGGYAGQFSRPVASAELFDPITNSFVRTGSLAQARFGANTIPLADGRVLIVDGGIEPNVSQCNVPIGAELYDPKTGTFSAGPTPPVRFSNPVVAGGRVLLLGGLDFSCTWLTTAIDWDPVSGTAWTVGNNVPQYSGPAIPLPNGRALISADNGHLYLLTA